MGSQDAASLKGPDHGINRGRNARRLDDDLALIGVQRIQIAGPEVQSYRGITLNAVSDLLGKIFDALLIRNRNQLFRPSLAHEFIGGLSFRAKTQNQDGFLAKFIERHGPNLSSVPSTLLFNARTISGYTVAL